MVDSTISGDGKKTIKVDGDGKITISSDQPLTADPELPVTDIRVNVLELAEVSLSQDGPVRTFRAKYHDGGSVEVLLNVDSGTMESRGNHVLSSLTDADDKSQTVLSFLPKKRFVSKKTH